MTQFRPEEAAEIKLAGWLMENGADVYLNRSGGAVPAAVACGHFNVKGTKKRPDMLLCTRGKYIAVEVKSGQGCKGTRDSRKIVDYYRDRISGEARYFIDNVEIFPTSFVVASFYSPEGRLFDEEALTHNTTPEIARIRGLPQSEYEQTFCFIRQVWDEWKPHKNSAFEMGALLSDKLDGGPGLPMLFIQALNLRSGKWNPPHIWRHL